MKSAGFHRKYGAIPNENLFYLGSLLIIKVTSVAKVLKITVTGGAVLKDFNFAAGLFSKDAHLKAIEGAENAERPSYNRI